MRVRVPADVDMADRIFAGLTARQLAILGGHGVLLVLLYVTMGARVQLALFGVVAAPIVLVGLLWATTSPDGTTWERIAAAAVRHFRRPRRRVLAPEGIVPLPAWAPRAAGVVAPLELPFEGASRDGHIDLGAEGTAAICRASSINFALRSETEQQALVEGFARLLNALDAPVQFLVRSNRADLRGLVDAIEEGAPGLPHSGLETAAREHGAFLRSLATRRDILSRQVLLCFRQPGGPWEERLSELDHRVEEAAALLRGLGVRLARLDGDQAAELLAAASDAESELAPRGSSILKVVQGTW
jgi:hypothetical protein